MATALAEAPYERASAGLLAKQPPTLKTPQKAGNDWGDIYAHLESRLQAMRVWRYSWWSAWSVLAEYLLPERYHWLIVANRMSRGRPLNDSIIDGTGTQSLEICASGLWTGLTSPSRPWFKLGIGLPWVELDAAGKAWLEDTEQRLYTVLGQSNFYNIMAQAFRDVVTFGTAPVVVYEDFEDILRFYLPCAGEYYLSVGSRLSVDTFYREFTLTVSQIVEMFTLEACPVEVRNMWAQGGTTLETEYVVAHAIEPNFALNGRNGGKITVVPGGFTYREVYWLRGNKTEAELSRRGFHEKPFMVARWSVVSNDPYGRSPGMKAIGDTKQLQLETRRKLELIDKLMRPPMGADVSLRNEPNSIIAGNTTYMSTAQGEKKFWPLFEINPQALGSVTLDLKDVQKRIEEYFYVPIFMAISRMEGVQPRNELELTKRDLERLQVLGPFISLFETEFASPALQRSLGVLQRRKMLKPMPPSLRNIPLKIEYVSIMRLAQRSAESVGMKDFLSTMGALSSAAKAAQLPDPLRVVNLDKSARKYADVSNYPSDCLFTDDEVQKHDMARQKAVAAQQAPAQAMAAVTAAKTLADTPLGGNSALGAIVGPTGGQ